MNVTHVKINLEFDIPQKIEGADLDAHVYSIIEQLMIQSVKAQLFYFKKATEPTFSVRAKNINFTFETDKRNVHII